MSKWNNSIGVMGVLVVFFSLSVAFAQEAGDAPDVFSYEQLYLSCDSFPTCPLSYVHFMSLADDDSVCCSLEVESLSSQRIAGSLVGDVSLSTKTSGLFNPVLRMNSEGKVEPGNHETPGFDTQLKYLSYEDAAGNLISHLQTYCTYKSSSTCGNTGTGLDCVVGIDNEGNAVSCADSSSGVRYMCCGVRPNIVYDLSCSVQNSAQSFGDRELLRLYNREGSHAQIRYDDLREQGTGSFGFYHIYPHAVTCSSESVAINTSSNLEEHKRAEVLRLSGTTNAHAQRSFLYGIPNTQTLFSSYYGQSVYLGVELEGVQPRCIYTSTSQCPFGTEGIVSISTAFNAHIAEYPRNATGSWMHVCCSLGCDAGGTEGFLGSTVTYGNCNDNIDNNCNMRLDWDGGIYFPQKTGDPGCPVEITDIDLSRDDIFLDDPVDERSLDITCRLKTDRNVQSLYVFADYDRNGEYNSLREMLFTNPDSVITYTSAGVTYTNVTFKNRLLFNPGTYDIVCAIDNDISFQEGENQMAQVTVHTTELCPPGTQMCPDGECRENCDEEPPKPYCGNNFLEPGEDCDGTDFGDMTCLALGFDGGVLSCYDNCTFNTNLCVEHICGDGIVHPGQECDTRGDGFLEMTCQQYIDTFQGGVVSVLPGNEFLPNNKVGCTSCEFNLNNCFQEKGNGVCGDGVLESDEGCEPNNFIPYECSQHLGEHSFISGYVHCNSECLVDTSGCISAKCGDGILHDFQQCEFRSSDGLGSQFREGQNTCESFGFESGNLACTDECVIDTSGCFNEIIPPELDCSEGVLRPGDQCVITGGQLYYCNEILSDEYTGVASCIYDEVSGNCFLDTSPCIPDLTCEEDFIPGVHHCMPSEFGNLDCKAYNDEFRTGDFVRCTDDCMIDTSDCGFPDEPLDDYDDKILINVCYLGCYDTTLSGLRGVNGETFLPSDVGLELSDMQQCPSCDIYPLHCYDGVQNYNEEGIDCGGDCAPCRFNAIEDPRVSNNIIGEDWVAILEERPDQYTHHCHNGFIDWDEEGIDCGSSSDCGVCATVMRSQLPIQIVRQYEVTINENLLPNFMDRDIDGDGTLNPRDSDKDGDGTPNIYDLHEYGITTQQDLAGDNFPYWLKLKYEIEPYQFTFFPPNSEYRAVSVPSPKIIPRLYPPWNNEMLCNYDGVCDYWESCTCPDCHNRQSFCVGNARCSGGVCQDSFCGDGIVDRDLGEECDDGALDTGGGCVNCRLAYCGDGFVRIGYEDCDDGPLNGLPGFCPRDCILPDLQADESLSDRVLDYSQYWLQSQDYQEKMKFHLVNYAGEARGVVANPLHGRFVEFPSDFSFGDTTTPSDLKDWFDEYREDLGDSAQFDRYLSPDNCLESTHPGEHCWQVWFLNVSEVTDRILYCRDGNVDCTNDYDIEVRFRLMNPISLHTNYVYTDLSRETDTGSYEHVVNSAPRMSLKITPQRPLPRGEGVVSAGHPTTDNHYEWRFVPQDVLYNTLKERGVVNYKNPTFSEVYSVIYQGEWTCMPGYYAEEETLTCHPRDICRPGYRLVIDENGNQHCEIISKFSLLTNYGESTFDPKPVTIHDSDLKDVEGLNILQGVYDLMFDRTVSFLPGVNYTQEKSLQHVCQELSVVPKKYFAGSIEWYGVKPSRETIEIGDSENSRFTEIINVRSGETSNFRFNVLPEQYACSVGLHNSITLSSENPPRPNGNRFGQCGAGNGIILVHDEHDFTYDLHVNSDYDYVRIIVHGNYLHEDLRELVKPGSNRVIETHYTYADVALIDSVITQSVSETKRQGVSMILSRQRDTLAATFNGFNPAGESLAPQQFVTGSTERIFDVNACRDIYSQSRLSADSGVVYATNAPHITTSPGKYLVRPVRRITEDHSRSPGSDDPVPLTFVGVRR